MPVRSLRVLHLLVPRRVSGETQVFLHRHPRWRQSSGGPLLALPATTLTDGDGFADRIRAVLHADLKLTELVPPSWRAFGEVEARAVSPARGELGAYRIRPVLARLPAVTHGRAARHADGCWLAPRAALTRPDLSPTARAVLERVAAGELLPPLPAEDPEAGGNRAVAARLAAARDGDMAQFAAVVRELEPLFLDRLRRTASTRALAARRHDLEDVLADAFASAMRHLEEFDPDTGSAVGWLWIIARNAAVSRLRRDRRPAPLPPDALDPRPRRPVRRPGGARGHRGPARPRRRGT